MKKLQTIKVGKRLIGQGKSTFIVAEISANHEQNFEKAVSLIKAAAWAGADAVKFQTFKPETMTLDCANKWFRVGGNKNPKIWQGKTFFNLYKEAYTPWEWFPKLKRIAERAGLIFFSTPFDTTAVDFLEKLHVPAYKIAAYESLDVGLLERVAKTRKPIIVSVGFSTHAEVKETVNILRKSGAKEIVVLQCTTSYADGPRVKATNLKTMLDIKNRFNVLTGLSDNMGGTDSSVLAAALGASVIEKHLVIKHGGRALDDRFSLDKREFKSMVDSIRRNEDMLGRVSYGPQTKEEKYNRNFRRSLFASANIKKGERFTIKNVRSVRPGFGLPPRDLKKVLSTKARVDIPLGTPLSWKLIV